MSKESKYTKNSIIGLVGKVSKLIGGYGTLWILTDILSDELYGGYVAALAVISLLTLLTQVGLKQATVQRISELSVENKEAVSQHAGAAITLVATAAIVISTVSWLAVQLASEMVDPIVVRWIRAFILLIPGMALVPICGGILRGLERVSTSIIFEQIAVQAIRLSGLVIAWLYWQDPTGVVLSIGIAYYLPISVFAVRAGGWKYLNLSGISFSHLQYSGYLLMNSIASKFLKETDILLLASLATLSATGGYNIAWKIAIIARYGDQILTSTMQPRISKFLTEGNLTELREEFNQIRDLSVLATIPVLILVLLFGTQLLAIFGNFTEQYAVLLILTTGAAINASFGNIGQVLLMGKQGRLVLFNTVISLGGNVTLNFVLIPPYGTVGAALATTASVFFLTNFAAVLQVKYFMRIDTFDPVMMLLVSVLAMSVALTVLGSVPAVVVVVLAIAVSGILAYRRATFISRLLFAIPDIV
jgi:O-antigen/teichoic acid export membrane protein